MMVFANLVFEAGASFALILPTHYRDLWFSPYGRMVQRLSYLLHTLLDQQLVYIAMPLPDLLMIYYLARYVN